MWVGLPPPPPHGPRSLSNGLMQASARCLAMVGVQLRATILRGPPEPPRNMLGLILHRKGFGECALLYI